MIEKTYLDYMTEHLTVPVYMEEPEYPGASYVVIQKTGGSIVNQVRSATFAVRSYGATLFDAANLNDEVIAETLAMTPRNGVFSAELNSDYEYSNTDTKQYRYQAVLVIYY